MKMNRKLLIAAAVLAAGAALAGCAPAASTAASSPAVSSQPAQAGSVVEPLSNFTITDPMADGEYPVSFSKTNLESTEGGYAISGAALYDYDLYDIVEVTQLKPGDTIRTHDAVTGQLIDVLVTTIVQSDGVITVNGGLDQGGLDLYAEDTVYVVREYDDYLNYYEIGTVTLPLAENVELQDSSAAPEAEAVVTAGDQAVYEAITAEDSFDYWSAGNTTVRVENGAVAAIVRRWVP